MAMDSSGMNSRSTTTGKSWGLSRTLAHLGAHSALCLSRCGTLFRLRGYRIRSLGALTVLAWNLLMHSYFVLPLWNSKPTDPAVEGEPGSSQSAVSFALSNVLIPAAFLLYPVWGYFGDVLWRKRNVMIVGTLLSNLSTALMVVCIYYLTNAHYGDELSYLFQLMHVIGLGMYDANYIQYGLEQVTSGGSDEYSNLIYWLQWMGYLLPTSAVLVLSYVSLSDQAYAAFFLTFITFFTALLLPLLCACRRNLENEPDARFNAFKHLWKVMCFARKHKYPVRRSAFTYNEMPSRLDLAKERYGGPFSSQEVEDVKSFWQILLVLLVLSPTYFMDWSSELAGKYLTFCNQSFNLSDLDAESRFVFTSSRTFTSLVVLIAVPIYKLNLCSVFSCPCFNKVMLKKMSLVYLFLIASYISQTLIDIEIDLKANNMTCAAAVSSEDFMKPFSPLIFLIPQFLNGLSLFFGITVFEFIVAQAPQTMRGILIGLWMGMFSFTLVQNSIRFNLVVHNQLKAYCITFVATLTCCTLLYVVVAARYRYRQRNERSDVNQRYIIEEHFERYLDQDWYYEDRSCVASVHT